VEAEKKKQSLPPIKKKLSPKIFNRNRHSQIFNTHHQPYRPENHQQLYILTITTVVSSSFHSSDHWWQYSYRPRFSPSFSRHNPSLLQLSVRSFPATSRNQTHQQLKLLQTKTKSFLLSFVMVLFTLIKISHIIGYQTNPNLPLVTYTAPLSHHIPHLSSMAIIEVAEFL